ncbi:MAG: Crp/Fnr family transcriptional regulator [Bacteroidia bacterium]
MTDKETLCELFHHSKLSAEELEIVVSAYKKAEYAKGDFILKAGQIPHSYQVVVSGMIRTYVINDSGDEISTGFYSKDQMVLDMSSFFLRRPSDEAFQAITDTVCWEIDFKSVQKLFHGLEAFREWGRSCLVQNAFQLKQRNISMVTDSAKDRYLALLKSHPTILQHAPIKHIASYLGITDTSLSRIRREVVGG